MATPDPAAAKSRRMEVAPGGDTDACPHCGIHRRYAGYLQSSCGDDFMRNGCFVVDKIKRTVEEAKSNV